MKLEEEAAGIALATEEEFTQYQQLKQVRLLTLLAGMRYKYDITILL